MTPHSLSQRLLERNAPLRVGLCVGVACVLVLGCRGQEKIHKKSINELYGEALQIAAERPPVIQPNPMVRRDSVAVYSQQAPNSDTVTPPRLPTPPASPSIPPVPTQQQPQTIERVQPYEPVPSVEVGLEPIANSGWNGPMNNPAIPSAVVPAGGMSQPANTMVVPVGNVAPAGAGVNLSPAVAQAVFQASVIPVAFQSQESHPLVSDDSVDADVREVLSTLGEQVDVPIILDELVNGNTSLRCNNEPLDQVLDRVLLPLGYYWVKSGKDYIVAPADPRATLFHRVSVRNQYRPKFHDFSELNSLLPERYKPFIQASKDQNLALIEAPKSVLEEILTCLRELDTPVPQVELEAIVCVTAPDSTFRFGLDWGRQVKVADADILKLGMTGLSFTGSGSRNGIDNAFSDFAVTSAFVKLLAQEGYITIRAAPRVTARDGQKASISINRETFFSLQPSSSNLLFRQDVQKVEAGIMLEIIPRVHEDMVAVKIVRAEVSEDIRSSSTNSELTSNAYPIIHRRQVSTDINVRDGHTIVIGGLVQRQTVDRINKIPGLSKVPLLGKMFQTIDKQEAEAEVAIFISPRVVPGEFCAP